jgi:hypothetical protein
MNHELCQACTDEGEGCLFERIRKIVDELPSHYGATKNTKETILRRALEQGKERGCPRITREYSDKR